MNIWFKLSVGCAAVCLVSMLVFAVGILSPASYTPPMQILINVSGLVMFSGLFGMFFFGMIGRPRYTE